MSAIEEQVKAILDYRYIDDLPTGDELWRDSITIARLMSGQGEQDIRAKDIHWISRDWIKEQLPIRFEAYLKSDEFRREVYRKLEWEYRNGVYPNKTFLWEVSKSIAYGMSQYGRGYGLIRVKHVHALSKEWLKNKLVER